MNHHADLGVSNTATEKEITDAYRKLAMKHHPDREGGNKEAFQRIQSAYAGLQATGFAHYSAPYQSTRPQNRPSYSAPETPGGTWRDRARVDETPEQARAYAKEAAEHAREAHAQAQARRGRPFQSGIRPDDEIIAKVSMREAFAGFNMQVPRSKPNGFIEYVHVNVPPGTPDGNRGRYKLSDGTTQVIITRIEKHNNYELRGFAASDSIFTTGLNIGDIEHEVELDALDLITGAWIKVKDFLGEELSVRVPAGFNPRQRLKVANKGYAGWAEELQEPTKFRRDMYLKLSPIFNKPQDIDPAKVMALYHAVHKGTEDAANA